MSKSTVSAPHMESILHLWCWMSFKIWGGPGTILEPLLFHTWTLHRTLLRLWTTEMVSKCLLLLLLLLLHLLLFSFLCLFGNRVELPCWNVLYNWHITDILQGCCITQAGGHTEYHGQEVCPLPFPAGFWAVWCERLWSRPSAEEPRPYKHIDLQHPEQNCTPASPPRGQQDPPVHSKSLDKEEKCVQQKANPVERLFVINKTIY